VRLTPRNLFPLLLALAALTRGATPARAQIPAAAHWRVISTPHFRVHFPQELEPLARRAGARAEEAWSELAEILPAPAGRVDLVVADNVDYSNGFATPFSRNRVVIYAHPPVDDPTLVFYDDWLAVVIIHELVHIFHLDYARGLPRLTRRVLGRHPAGFPEPTAPAWTTEGLAVYLESRLTGAGRVRGSMHQMALRTAVLDSSFFTLDRASGNPESWPGGSTPYVYGSLFMQYLAERHGPEAAAEFVRRYGGQAVPWLLDRAARRSYGVSFSRAWREWRAELETRYRAQADSLRAGGLTEPQILTPEGREAAFPRWSPDGGWITYAAATGREEAQQRLVDASGRQRRLAPRTTLGPTAWSAGAGWLLTAMIDLRDPYHALSDLYRIDAAGGSRRLTRGARLSQPDLARDGRIVAIQSAGGTNLPVLLDSAGGTPRPLAAPSLEVQWATPRWSPDGTRIAFSRWRTGGWYDVVLLDSAGREQRALTHDRAVDSSPSWSPDGRWVIFSSDRTGIANLYAFDTGDGSLWQVTQVLSGAFQPDVSPDGRSIAFQYYQSDGYHIARIPFDRSSWRPAPPVRPELAPSFPVPAPAPLAGPAKRYWALRSALPSYWEPTWYDGGDFGLALGVASGGHDVIERHLWGAGAQVYTRDGRTEASAAYLYRGLGNPSLGMAVFQDWDVIGQVQTGVRPGGTPLVNRLDERERSLSAVATFSRPRYRSFAWLSLGGNLRDRYRVWAEADTAQIVDPPPDIGAIASVGITSARAFAWSVGTQEGVLAALAVEGRRFTRPLPGETQHRGYTRVNGRLQGYHGVSGWGYGRHVLAVRAAGGADFGSRTQYFGVGGVRGDALAFPLSTGTGLGGTRDLFVRGYPEGSQFGDRALAASAEWRFPLARVERGVGLLPVFLNRLSGTAFSDVGSAWCVQGCDPRVAAAFPSAEPLWSVGAELGGDLLVGFHGGIRVRVGAALPLSRVPNAAGARRRPGGEVYVDVGQSF
jgi:hypothetical protein